MALCNSHIPMGKETEEEEKEKSKLQRLLLVLHHWHRIQSRSEINEGIFFAWNRETTHWMIKAKLFLRQMQQILKGRMIQIRYRNHKSLLLDFSHIYRTMAFWHTGLVSTKKWLQFQNLLGIMNLGRQTDTHHSICRKNGKKMIFASRIQMGTEKSSSSTRMNACTLELDGGFGSYIYREWFTKNRVKGVCGIMRWAVRQCWEWPTFSGLTWHSSYSALLLTRNTWGCCY